MWGNYHTNTFKTSTMADSALLSAWIAWKERSTESPDPHAGGWAPPHSGPGSKLQPGILCQFSKLGAIWQKNSSSPCQLSSIWLLWFAPLPPHLAHATLQMGPKFYYVLSCIPVLHPYWQVCLLYLNTDTKYSHHVLAHVILSARLFLPSTPASTWQNKIELGP